MKRTKFMKDFTAVLLLLLFFGPLQANSPVIIRATLQWEEEATQIRHGGGSYEQWLFAGAVISDEPPGLPYFVRRFPLNSDARLRVEVLESRYEPFEWQPSSGDTQLGESLQIQRDVERSGRQYFGKIAFLPIVQRGGRFERLVEVVLRITPEPVPPRVSTRGPDNTRQSVLQDGQIYKIAVNRAGVHRISYNFIKDELGIDIDNIDPRRLQLLGNGGGMLPENINTGRIDDLAENPIFITGEEDGSFDAGDYLLFYAQGPDLWQYDEEEDRFRYRKNIYDTRNYYFLKVGSTDGRRVQPQSSRSGAAFTVNSFESLVRFEEDRLNLLHEWRPLAQGSGPRWYNNHFKNQREYRFSGLFEFPNLDPAAPVTVEAEMALRATTSSRFTVEVNGQVFNSDRASAVTELSGSFANEISYAHAARARQQLTINRPGVDVVIRYPHPQGLNDGSEGWLDYIQVRARRALTLTGDQLFFHDTRTLAYPDAAFQIRNGDEHTRIWEVTNPVEAREQEFIREGEVLRFAVSTERLRRFVAFQVNGNLPAPEAVGAIDNQNIHGIDGVDMVIITHPDFVEQAEQLAAHRRRHSGLEVRVVQTGQLYNEFSSGRVDPTAIRDFAHMLFERSDRFRYLLLMGDGSFDCRNIYELGGNFVPVYETDSFNPIFSFPSDDYYALLNDGSGNTLSGALDIALGRIPVKSVEEAQQLVAKIINYDTNAEGLGDWRNRVAFIADDQDGMIHNRQAEQIADTIGRRYPYLNIDKIYLDAFPQVSTPGGTRFPAANEAINQSVFRGTLAMTYLGHGGSGGLAEERVLEIPDLLNWKNFDRPPLLITATCSFAGYDDPAFVTAGEEAILNARGGAIALLTTVRAVFSNSNRALTEQVLRRLFERPDGLVQPIGDVMLRAKNQLTSLGVLTNSRKFTLLGDPAMKVAQPDFQVRTTRINDKDIGSGPLDTLRALQRVTIEGEVLNVQGERFEDFSGILYPTIFDKKIELKTLGQDNDSSPLSYDLQKNTIFKGRATVENGRFRFTFVVPKDINYQLGPGKISYYAADERTMLDATGAFESVIIGGADPNAAADDQGPLVEVFMNTEDFAFGGVTDESPTLLITLEDDNGINVVGNSIGHDLEGFLDEDTQNAILLNDFYESDLDNYRRGTVRYPLTDLEEGRHSLRVKAWDVANNSAEGYTEFVVAASGEIALQHVLNYPNPFSDYTCFQFDHNLAGQELDVLVQIFTISGRLVKTLEQTIFSDGAIRRDNCLEWDGRDDFGDPLARGVYLYKVKVRATNTGNTTLEGESEFEKLVLLK